MFMDDIYEEINNSFWLEHFFSRLVNHIQEFLVVFFFFLSDPWCLAFFHLCLKIRFNLSMENRKCEKWIYEKNYFYVFIFQ